jgi:hypothetical protein
MFCDSANVLSFSFPFPPSQSSIGSFPLLQKCSTYDLVHDHACFYVYVYLLNLYFM